MTQSKNLKIFNASAGSGKTYTLVQEYLRIILPKGKDPMSFKRILAMTFTNKAANEMKERIIQKLIQLSKSPEDRTADDNKEITAFSSALGIQEQALCEQAKNCLNAILHNYGQFSVMTIDKFTHKVIRTFAKELGLSLDFEVELDLDSLRKNVADLLFDRIGREEEITQLMLRYAQHNLEEDKSWKFKDALVEFSKQLYREDAIEAIKQLSELSPQDFMTAQDNMIKERAQFKAKIKRLANEALDVVSSKGLSAEDFMGKSRGIISAFETMAKPNEVKPFTDAKIRDAEADEWGHPTSPNKSEADALTPVLKNYFNQILQTFEDGYSRYILNVELLKLVNNLSLMKHLLDITEELKEQDNVLLISDFYKTISDVITKEPVPFIYERLGVRYEHFLLDEFQDTSHLQWVNLVPLLHNSVSMNKENLIVGDGKQAIYRWRNGEVEQFVNLPGEVYNPTDIASLYEAESSFRQQGELMTLKTNYRSAPEIVNFNNELFDFLVKDKGSFANRIYQESSQKPNKSHQGYLEFKIYEEKDELIQLKYVIDTIKTALEKGYQWSDICILVSKNRTGSTVARFLTNNGVKVISQDSLYVSKDLKVRFVFNLICSLANQHNLNYAKKCIEQFDMISGNKQHLFDLLESDKIDLVKWFQAHDIALKPNEHFHSFYEYIEHLITAFDLDVSNNVYLQYFLEQVHEFEKRHSSDVHYFIEWFNETGFEQSIQSPEGANAVRIMTIHKAKGLQFPVVICPFFDWNITDNKTKKWIKDTDELLPAFPLPITNNARESSYATDILEEDVKFELDQLNLVYVALTRPETALFVCGSTHKNRRGSVIKNWMMPFLEQSDLMQEFEGAYRYGELNTATHQQEEISSIHINFCKQIMDKPELSTKNGDQWDINDLDKKREFGKHLHLLLSRIEDKSQIKAELDFLITKGKISAEFEEKMKAMALSLFEDEHFAKYFEGKSSNEKAIIDKDGNRYIPDKIIDAKSEILVVDFKTGEAYKDKHKEQVQQYMTLLNDLYNKPIKGEIYYTEKKEVTLVESV